MSNNDVLIGKFVSWPNSDEGEHYMANGRGDIVAVLDDSFLLIRTVAREDDDEPPRMFIISMKRHSLYFWDSLRDEETWYDWISEAGDDSPVISLASRKPRDHEH